MRTRFVSVSLFVVLAVSVAWAQTPLGTAFTYQGQLKQNGTPVSGSANLVFSLYDDPTIGNLLGTQTLNSVPVASGLFTVQLNGAGEFGASAFNGEQRWLEISVNGAPLSPRQELTATPYATFASAPWTTAAGNVSYSLGKVGIGTNAPQALLHLGGTAGVDGLMFPDSTLQTTAATGGSGFWSPSGAHIYNNNTGNVGIGTVAPASKLDIAATGDGAELLRFSTERPWVFRQTGSGSGAYLQLLSTVGLKLFEITAAGGTNVATFIADDANPRVGIGTTAPASKLDIAATGVGAELLRFSTERPWVFRQTLTGPSTGLELFSTSGQKTFQITAAGDTNVATFVADDANPRVGIGTGNPTSPLTVVGTGISPSIYATGVGPSIYALMSGSAFGSVSVEGFATAASGDTTGVWGRSASITGVGVYGLADAPNSATYGVLGNASELAGWSVYAIGRLGASGTKSSRIDHPFDPENKYLLHYCTEGPQPYNVYKGRVTTDTQGYSWIELPDYFEEINRDVDYQLTVIDDSDDFVLVKVTKEIAGNRFQIRSSRPNVKVCWEVKGVRNDRFVRTYGAPVEVEKGGAERGKYQHPELYGQPPEMGMHYRAAHERPSPVAPPEATPR